MEDPRERSEKELMLRKSAEVPTFKIEMIRPQAEPQRTPPPPEPQGLLEYWRMIERRKWLLAAMTFGCAIAGLGIGMLQTPMYQARASLEVQGPNENFLNLKDLDPASSSGPSAAESYVETQARILQDEGFIERVVTKQGIARQAADLRGPGLLQRLHLAKTSAGTISHDAAVSLAAKNVSVHASSESHVIDVTFDAANPRLAARFANGLADELIDQSVNVRLDAARRVSESLGRQLLDLKSSYERSATQLQEYAQSTGLIFNADKGTTAAEQELLQVQEELGRAQADLAAKQSKYEMAKTAPPDTLPEVLDNATLKDYRVKLTDLKRQLAEMESTFTPAYFKVKNLKAEIAELETAVAKTRANVVDRLRNEYQAAAGREKLVEQRYTAQNKVVAEEASRAVHYNVLKREVDTNRAMYEAALQKVKEAGVAAAIRASNIRLISSAKPPLHPYKPKPLFNAGMGLLAGLFLGFTAVFLRESTDRSLRAPGDISTYLNLPELGAIPTARIEPLQAFSRRKDMAIDLVPEDEGGAAKSPDTSKVVEMISCRNQGSPLAESFRSALASLWFSGQNGKRPRVFVLTSPNAREGKTTLTTNLGIALANTNRRVLLIDGDIRKPRLHSIFNVSNSWGLGNLLEDDCPIEDYNFEDIVLQTSVPGLFILPAGSGEVNVSSLRYHERLTDVLMRFKLEFHAVLLDTPPMLEFSDARVLGRLSDGVIMVVRASETSRDDAAAVYRRFQEDGTPVLGSILNDWNPKKSNHGYGYRTSGVYEDK